MNDNRRKVHIRNLDGKLLYTRLYDDGTNVLVFESGNGFLTREQVASACWRIEAGWPETTAAREARS